ncbi:hypothetical protein LCGC14_1739320 [marine sediment metagenome]|uniref:Uncharacterized protein n=1 Tax=marine sediment metagenome TaxID=412755 RepID=A0A0F9JMG5_9ZZZZ
MTAACIPLQYNSPFFVPTDRGVSDDAQALNLFVEKMLEDCSQSVIIGANESLQELYNLWEECVSENWDGYGAQPVDPNSFNEAERFIRALPTTVRKPEVAVDPDGEISLEWYLEARKVFSVSIGKRNEITYAGLYGLNKTYGREYFDDEIPKAIFDNLDRLFS